MATPRMFVIAGPPGAGKSSVFSLSKFAERTFNADDRAAELNSGSYQDIPLSIRAIVNREFENSSGPTSGRATPSLLRQRFAVQSRSIRRGLRKRMASGLLCATLPWKRRNSTSSGYCSALPAPGIRPVKRPYGEFTLTASEICQPLSFPPKAVSSPCAYTITPGSGSLRSWFCKRSKGESSEWVTIFRCGFSLPWDGLPPEWQKSGRACVFHETNAPCYKS